jgi:MGT family glycosyltransferase
MPDGTAHSDPDGPGTRPAHIAFMAVPTHGDLDPTLGVVTELVKRGHRVTYATNEEFAPRVEAAGAKAVRYSSTLPSPSDPASKWPSGWDMTFAMRMFLDELVEVLPQVAEAYRGDEPDLVVYEVIGWHGPILAEKWGVPAIQLSPMPVAYEGMENDIGLEPTPEFFSFVEDFGKFVAEQDVTITPADIQMNPRRCVALLPRAFQIGADSIPDNYTFVGPVLSELELDGSWTKPDDRPVVLVSLGTVDNDVPRFFRLCVEAFSGLGWHVVLTTGGGVDPAELGEVPDDVEVHTWVPQLQVLAQASAFVTHAGLGSVLHGMYHGVPMIAVPPAAQQVLNAKRLDDLGLGVHLPMAEVTAAGLRETLLAVAADEEMAGRLDRMRELIARSGGAAEAADIVEAELP